MNLVRSKFALVWWISGHLIGAVLGILVVDLVVFTRMSVGHVRVLCLSCSLQGLLFLEVASLDDHSDECHNKEATDVHPIPWIDVIQESFLGHLSHSDLVVVVAGIAGSAADHCVGAKEN